MRTRLLALTVIMAVGGAVACGDDEDEFTGVPVDGGVTDALVVGDGAITQFVINISNFTFEPANLVVPPGATVTVRNADAALHSVTSQAAAGAFSPGAVAGVSFDTGAFGLGERTFTIPGNAPSGTVVPYFCKVHLSEMRNAGQITIQ